MRRLSAISIGSRVTPLRVQGTIHSVFTDACNVENAEGEIFTFLTSRTPDQPGGIRLVTPPDFSFGDDLVAGDRVSCQPVAIEVPVRGFSIDLRHADVWSRRLPMARNGLAASKWQAAAAAFLVISRHGVEARPSMMIPPWDLAVPLTGAVSKKNWEKARGAMRMLIGCGPGLTPWGDDFVAGFIAGYECLSGSGGEGALTRLRTLCSERVATTSDIGRSILRDAIAGLYGSPVYDLCEAILHPESSLDISRQVRSHMDIGDSSGEANAYGILSGMAAASGSAYCLPIRR